MAKRSLLLVDGDARSLRVLEVSLKKAGFTVTTASDGEEATAIVAASPPDLIISNTDLAGVDGFEFCKSLKEHEDESLSSIPFIFLTDQHSIEHKIRGLELGVDEYLTKPIYIKEILTRVRILLQKRDRVSLETRKGESTRFAGKLSDMGVVDLIQTIEVSAKSGVSHFTSADGQRASLYFRSGRVIDADLGSLQGADAIYRLLTWSEGDFEVLFRAVRRRDVIALSSQALLMEGMRRLDEWGRLLEQLPPLESRFEVVYHELAERLGELPDELNEILKLFDGRRSLIDIIDQTPQGDLESLELIAKLFFEGLIVETEQPLDNVPEPVPATDSEPIELPPARIRTASQLELEHDPGEEVFALSEALSPDGQLAPDDDINLPRRPSLIDAAIDAVAPLHPELGPLPGLGQSISPPAEPRIPLPPARPSEQAAAAELAPASESDGEPGEPDEVDESWERELGKLTPERRSLQMLPTLVEKVRHVGERSSSVPPPRPNEVEEAHADAPALESKTEEAAPTNGAGSGAALETPTPLPRGRGSDPPSVAARDESAAAVELDELDELDRMDHELESPDHDDEIERAFEIFLGALSSVEDPPDSDSDSDSDSDLDSRATIPTPVAGEGSVGASAAVTDVDEPIERDTDVSSGVVSEPMPELESLPLTEGEETGEVIELRSRATPTAGAGESDARSPAQELRPRLEVVEDTDDGHGFDEVDDLPGFDEITPVPDAVLPPSSRHSTPIDSPHVISSAGQEVAAVGGEIAGTDLVEARSSGRRHSVVIEDDELQEPEEPTVEEPLSGRNRPTTSPPPLPPRPGRSRLPVIAGVLATGVLIAAIFAIRAVVPGGGSPDLEPIAHAGDAASHGGAGLDAGVALVDAAPVATDASEGFIDYPTDASIESVDAAPVLDPAEQRKKRADDLYQRARRASRRGDRQGALQLVQEAIEVRRTSRYVSFKAQVMLRLQNREAAIRSADEALAMSGRLASAWLTKGQAHYELAQYGEAKGAFERYLQLRPTGKTADEVRIILESL